MPKKWKIYRTYAAIYHKTMHDWLIKLVDDYNTSSLHMLAIMYWRAKYYEKMGRLGWSTADLQPDLLDDRESELVRNWRQLIVNKVEEWINRMFETDSGNFLSRSEDAIEKDHIPAYIKEDLQAQLSELKATADKMAALK